VTIETVFIIVICIDKQIKIVQKFSLDFLLHRPDRKGVLTPSQWREIARIEKRHQELKKTKENENIMDEPQNKTSGNVLKKSVKEHLELPSLYNKKNDFS
jgi:hypothetical protein